MKRIFMSIVMAVVIFSFPGNGRAEDAFSLYGVSLDSTYDQVLTNGLERGYKVSCTFIPSAFSKKIPKDMFFFHNYFEVYDSLKKIPNIEIITDADELKFVDNGLRNLANKGQRYFDEVVYKGKDIPETNVVFYKSGPDSRKLLMLLSKLSGYGANRVDGLVQGLKEKYGSPKEILIEDDVIVNEKDKKVLLWRHDGQMLVLDEGKQLLLLCDTPQVNAAFDEIMVQFNNLVNQQRERQSIESEQQKGQSKSNI